MIEEVSIRTSAQYAQISDSVSSVAQTVQKMQMETQTLSEGIAAVHEEI
jgi:hypothetical protein